jgi:hypothetical protein
VEEDKKHPGFTVLCKSTLQKVVVSTTEFDVGQKQYMEMTNVHLKDTGQQWRMTGSMTEILLYCNKTVKTLATS